MDLLIPLDKDHAMYTPLEERNLPEGFSADTPIIAWHEDGYCSCTFHCRNAVSSIAVQPLVRNPEVLFFTDVTQAHENTRDEHENYALEHTYVRLAMLNSRGNILQFSAPHRANTNKLFRFTLGEYVYDAAEDILTVDTYFSGIGVPFYFILSILGILLTVLSEWIVCRAFGLRDRYGKLVVGVNFLSQFSMRVLYLLLYSILFFDYAWATFLLEALVFLCEYRIYRRRMGTVSKKTCLLFTLTANLVSFVLGFGLNRILFFRLI